MRRIAAAAVAFVVAAGIADTVARDTATARATVAAAATPVEAVNALLDQRERAVREGDVDRWLATIDPEASAGFRQRQARLFAGWIRLPLAKLALEADVGDTGDLAAGSRRRLLRDHNADEVLIPETRQEWRLRGFDDRDAVDRLWYTYVRRGDRWYVSGDDDLTFVGLDSTRMLWELGSIRLNDTGHFLVISHEDNASRADEVGAIAERSYDVFDARWDEPWSGRLPIILPSSIDELETLLQSTFDLTNFVAFVGYDEFHDDDEYVIGAPRMYVQDDNLSRHSTEFQQETIVHELLHAATAHLSGPHIPPWVHEGLADWLATGMAAGGNTPDGSDGELPEPFEFVIGGGSSIFVAYAESSSAMAHLAALRGSDAPVELFIALGRRRETPGSENHNVGAALRRVGVEGLEQFEDDWAAQ